MTEKEEKNEQKEGQAEAEDTELIREVLALYFIYPETQN